MNRLKIIIGLALGVFGTISAFRIWPLHSVISFLLALVVLSFLVEIFKQRKLQKYDWFAGLIILIAFVYIEFH